MGFQNMLFSIGNCDQKVNNRGVFNVPKTVGETFSIENPD